MERPLVELSPRFREALTYAAALHSDQRRKASGEPYVAHLLAVAAGGVDLGHPRDGFETRLDHKFLDESQLSQSRLQRLE